MSILSSVGDLLSKEPEEKALNREYAWVNKDKSFSTPFTIFEMEEVWPDENPKNSLDDITKALGYAGVFDDIKE